MGLCASADMVLLFSWRQVMSLDSLFMCSDPCHSQSVMSWHNSMWSQTNTNTWGLALVLLAGYHACPLVLSCPDCVQCTHIVIQL